MKHKMRFTGREGDTLYWVDDQTRKIAVAIPREWFWKPIDSREVSADRRS